MIKQGDKDELRNKLRNIFKEEKSPLTELLNNMRLIDSNYDSCVIMTELDSLICESLSRVLGVHKAYEITEAIKRLTGMSPAEILINNPRDFVTAFERVLSSPTERILHEVFKVLSYMTGINEEPPDIIDSDELTKFIKKVISVIISTKAKYFTRITNNVSTKK